MTFDKKNNQIKKVDQLIRAENTGNVEELAKKLQVSKSTIYGIFKFMRSIGGAIEYSKSRQTFQYTNSKIHVFGFEKF